MVQHGPHDEAGSGGVRVASPDQITHKTHRSSMGDITRLAHKIKRSDRPICPPAVVRDGNGVEVLMGGRRMAALDQLSPGSLHHVVHVVSSWSELEAWMQQDTTMSEGSDIKPTSLLEAVDLLGRIEALFKPRVRQSAPAKLAGYLGLDVAEFGCVRTVLRRYVNDTDADADLRAYAIEQLALADRGEIAASTVLDRVKKRAAGSASPKMSVADQRHRLQTAGATLTGVCAGLAEIGTISPDLTDSETEMYIEVLSAARLQLERTLKALRAKEERTS